MNITICTDLELAYKMHIQNPETQREQFWYDDNRYVICDKCRKLTPTSDCLYYGGEGERINMGGCRDCFGGARP